VTWCIMAPLSIYASYNEIIIDPHGLNNP
jgi:hypothetical protein